MNKKITAYHYSSESGLLVGTSPAFIEYGYDHYIKPQCATFTSPPEFDSATQQCRYLPESDSWQVEARSEVKEEQTETSLSTQAEPSGDAPSITDQQTLSAPAKPGAVRRLLNRLTSR
ncbi:hypothetical protein [Vibrio rhizosphaerae]|uniref:hypothetical protein n=1 Tax=Vibrio rhizosphaerae TaxID=398736 RepID=UPI00068A10E0|nr:hypothetical protein [Vibrio rhizosphaerae]